MAMDGTSQEFVHRAKRRRLDDTLDDLNSANKVPSYITIAKADLPITIQDSDEVNGMPRNDLQARRINIVAVTAWETYQEVEVSAKWLNRNLKMQAFGDENAACLLKDCVSIAHYSKVLRTPTRPLLVCYDAEIRHNSEDAFLTIKILWHDTCIARDRVTPRDREILRRYSQSFIQSSPQERRIPWSVQEFYHNVHVPEVNAETNADLKNDLLHCELYPFQRRAVRWLLAREGVEALASGQIVKKNATIRRAVNLHSFTEQTNQDGERFVVDDALGVVCSSVSDVHDRYGDIKGGLLGEAMGLGKTVEIIALMTLHTQTRSPLDEVPTSLCVSGATLIITPPTILEQWKQELHAHAPSLRVYHYQGGSKSRTSEGLKAAIEMLVSHDVVLTTYNVISKELYYVQERPDRALRSRPRADPPKSPLNQILWWRVCLDEAQMIESGVSAAATVARLIPRVNAWAVTGTPLRQSHQDLYGLLLFLRYEPWCSSLRLWEYLISNHRSRFRRLMSEMALRHSKEVVRDELRLPLQHRHTITISFTNIEQAHYAQLFYEMYQDCGLSRHGAPEDQDWDPNHPKIVEKMRTWLTRLRQTCLHPEVGGRNRKALGRTNLGGPLRTVHQVLDVMIDQNEGMLRAEQRNMLVARLRKGQMYENAKRREEAMELYRLAYDEASEFVSSCREALEAEIASHARTGTQREDEKDDESEDEQEDDAQQLTARQRLRSALEVKHICIFFIANIYFQMKSEEEHVRPGSEEFQDLEKHEAAGYEEAKKIRGELLAEVARKVNRRIRKGKLLEQASDLVVIPPMDLDPDEYSGLESRKIFEKLFHFCQAMNIQAAQFQLLRGKMMDFLRQALIDEDEGIELQGDEYENSTKHQDEMYAYMEALRALYADRYDAATGQENLLIRSEMKNFLRDAKEGNGPAPELMIRLLAERDHKRININKQGSLRGIVAEVRALVSALDFQEAAGSARAKAELGIATGLLQRATQLMSEQSKCLNALEQEIGHFRNSMNARLEYYKGLQKISDTVAPYKEEDVGKPLNEREFKGFEDSENAARNKYANLEAKKRYLIHLKDESTADSTPRICTICQSEFEIGAITSCGHVFCKEDLQLWYAAHGNCPICKRKLRSADFFDVTYKPTEMTVQADPTTLSTSIDSSPEKTVNNNSIYSDISGSQLNAIKNIDLRGASFGSKVDTICRHLHWLREQDPGSKTIIFSQFREVLDVLGRAFRQNNVSFARCDDRTGIEDFKANPAIECFLLHAKAHSAGLNLVVASHVILCEPLINTAIELQAIARVHRIGQHRATTVWMYLIADTVEESIYEISVQRRLAHLKGRKSATESESQTLLALPESAIDAANSKELEEANLAKALAPGINGGELVDRDDLWPCLFGRVNGSHSAGGRPSALELAADTAPADGPVARFLRAEAAESRRT